MDPNPLQYQAPNENEPLYRAAMLSTGIAVAVIVLALGINYVFHHSGSATASNANPALQTSPDDTVNGMKRELAGDTTPTSSAGPMFIPAGANPIVGNGQFDFSAQRNTGPYPGGYGQSMSFVKAYPGNDNQPHALAPLNTTAMRDYASIDPDNIADLLSGR
jgi:hypothetical protein